MTAYAHTSTTDLSKALVRSAAGENSQKLKQALPHNRWSQTIDKLRAIMISMKSSTVEVICADQLLSAMTAQVIATAIDRLVYTLSVTH
jgi:hypothetical protein